jgi:hypothetical protein
MRCLWLPMRVFFLLLFSTLPVVGVCIPFTDALSHIGETGCVSGRVLHVKRADRGIHYLDFCQDYRLCPFTVVVFPRDLKHVGDVRDLEGKLVEIHGPVKSYDGRAEIVLSEARQVKGANIHLPPVPKDYDVERKGRFSAGTFRPSKSRAKSKRPKTRTSRPIDELGDEN